MTRLRGVVAALVLASAPGCFASDDPTTGANILGANGLPAYCAAYGVGQLQPPAPPGPNTQLEPYYQSIDEFPVLPYLDIRFADPFDRAMLIEQDLRFVEVVGSAAVYEVTGPQPRLYMHGIEPDLSEGFLHIRLCGNGVWWGGFDDGVERSLTLNMMAIVASESEPQFMGDDRYSRGDWGEDCSYPVDTGDRFDTTEPVEAMYIELNPAPSVGSYFVIRMIAIESPEVRGHDGGPDVCCVEEHGCGTRDEPPGPSDPPDDSGDPEPPNPSDPPGDPGDPEPPNPSDPPGSPEPPSPSDPPGSGEPPGTSIPPECQPQGEPPGRSGS